MNAHPLCIIQARLHSTRLPQKMLLPIGGESVIERGHRIACEAFGREHVVVAIPANDANGPLGDELRRIGAAIFAVEGDNDDVLARLYRCATWSRWHPESIIVRWTPDDFRKDPELCRRVAAGARYPVAQSCEAFTLADLRKAHARACPGNSGWTDGAREHVTYAIPHLNPVGVQDLRLPDDGYPWSIDTEDDYRRACEWVEKHEGVVDAILHPQ